MCNKKFPKESLHYSIRGVGLQVDGPNWRWQRAMRIVGTGRAYNAGRLGPVIWQVVHHHRPIRQGRRLPLLRNSMVDVAGAKAIYGDPELRMKTEAWLLSGLSHHGVAKRLRIKAELVRDYRDIFFDVQDHLRATGWIMEHVVTNKTQPPDFLRRALYLAAYRGGPVVCEHWLDHLGSLGQEHDLETSQGRAAERLDLCVLETQVRCEVFTRRVQACLVGLSQPERQLPNTIATMMNARTRDVLRSRLAGQLVEPPAAALATSGKACEVA